MIEPEKENEIELTEDQVSVIIRLIKTPEILDELIKRLEDNDIVD